MVSHLASLACEYLTRLCGMTSKAVSTDASPHAGKLVSVLDSGFHVADFRY